MIPLWITFIMCGLVSSVGDTFFIEQASYLDPSNLSFLLLIFQKIAQSMFAIVTKELIKKASRKYAAAIGNIAATIISLLCCITAAVASGDHEAEGDRNEHVLASSTVFPSWCR
jgi:peptide/histidine transporter 3/4